MEMDFVISDRDFDMAGEASSSVKRTLSKLGAPPAAVKRAAISMYEAEIKRLYPRRRRNGARDYRA